MAKIEPGVYEPRADDIRVFDGAEDDVDEEGSRLPLLIVIALLVLAAFAGVVYLAYTEGVQKGRADAPRVITAQPGPAKVAPTDAQASETPYKGLKIYEQPAPTDEDEDTAPPPPTEIKPGASATVAPTVTKPAVAPTTNAQAAATAPPATAKPAPVETKPAAATTKPAPATTKPAPATTKPAAATPTQTASAAPRSLAPVSQGATTTAPAATKPPPAATKPAPVETKPAPAAAAPAATSAPAVPSGSYLVQVGSYPSEADAQAAFAGLKRKNGALLSGYSSNIKRVDLGAKGVWFRLRVGPVADREAAQGLAERLGGGAFPSKP